MRKIIFLILAILLFEANLYGEENTPVLTLEECLKHALANNPKLQEAVSTVGINKARKREANSDYLPKVTTSASYAHATANAGLSAAGTIAGAGNTYITQTGLEQLIWDFGRTLNQIKLAKENLTSAEYAFLEAQEGTILNTKRTYYEALKSQLLVDVSLENLGQSKIHFGKTKGFYDVGLKQKFDLTQEEVKVSNSNLDYIKAKKNYQLAKASLNKVMGKIQDTNYRLEEMGILEPLEVNLNQAIEAARKNRSEILRKESELKAAQTNLEIKKTGNWPKLTADTSYGNVDTKTSGSVDSLNFGLLLKWPWFDSFKTESQIEAAKENVKIARASFQGATLDIILEVQDAVLSLDEAKEKIKASDKLLDEASQNLEIVSARHKEGLSSAVELQDAKSALITAKKNYVITLADYLIAQANYEKAVGTIGQKGEGK